jgi:hypothetical protein
MGCEMWRSMLIGLIVLALAGCGKEDANVAQEELAETPQIASLDDYNLPVDKSDQITAIDAATGDASGMPRDGGKAIELPKQDERPDQAKQATSATTASNATMSIPEVAPPPPPPTAPALTMPIGN